MIFEKEDKIVENEYNIKNDDQMIEDLELELR